MSLPPDSVPVGGGSDARDVQVIQVQVVQMVTVNVVVLAGRVAAEPVERQLPSGDEVTELRISVPESGKRLLPLPVAVWHGSVDRATVGEIAKGDDVLVYGQLTRRFYRSGAGARSLTEVVATGIKKLEPANPS
jgi:single-strand DNA-binding protein